MRCGGGTLIARALDRKTRCVPCATSRDVQAQATLDAWARVGVLLGLARIDRELGDSPAGGLRTTLGAAGARR